MSVEPSQNDSLVRDQDQLGADFATETVTAQPDTDRRKLTERRIGMRRAAEQAETKQRNNMAFLSTVCALIAVGVGAWCLLNAPITTTPTRCAGLVNDEVMYRRGVHPGWLVAVLFAVVALFVPVRKHRSFVSVGLVGLTIGLLIASLARVAQWKSGLCFA